MDVDAVTGYAYELLSALSRYGGQADQGSAIDLTRNQDPAWRTDPAIIRRGTQAFNLLRRAGYVEPGDPPSLLRITNRGRNALLNTSSIDLDATLLSRWVQEEELKEGFQARNRINANTFSRLEISKWRQFEGVSIDFHSKLTVLTGANASGKTTLLNILAPHFNWYAQLISDKRAAKLSATAETVGALDYTNGATSNLVENIANETGHNPLQMTFMQQVPGLFISSHRSISAYQPLASLPAQFSESEVLLSQFAAEVQVRYSGGTSQYPPLYRMKEALYAAAMYAYGSEALEASDSAREVWEQFQETLRNFLPKSLDFVKLKAAHAEILVETVQARFPIEAVSGGISAMIELAWQIFLRSRDQESFTVCIDEPENHLHPELQRSIMPSLISAFPQVSYIVATHSPFVVTSEPSANVFALQRRDASAGISSRKIETVNFSGTADEILLDVLGLDTALPLWAQDRIQDALRVAGSNPSAADLRRLRSDLEGLGLARQFPAAVEAISGSEVEK